MAKINNPEDAPRLSYMHVIGKFDIDSVQPGLYNKIGELDFSRYERPFVDASVSEGLDASTFSISGRPQLEDREINEELKNREPEFITYLMDADFSVEYENDATLFIDGYKDRYPNAFNFWLSDFFNCHMQDDELIIQLLKLFQCYMFEELPPVATTIGCTCIGFRDAPEVQSANLSLLGHWCNLEAARLIQRMELPSDPWIRVKYERLNEIILSRCTISER